MKSQVSAEGTPEMPPISYASEKTSELQMSKNLGIEKNYC